MRLIPVPGREYYSPHGLSPQVSPAQPACHGQAGNDRQNYSYEAAPPGPPLFIRMEKSIARTFFVRAPMET